jgi:type IV secretory pathway VirB4 component
MANREREFLERIRFLEEQNSALQDKLDMIYAILAPDYEEDDSEDSGLVQIEKPR